MTPQQHFLRYAYPCTHIPHKQKQISDAHKEELRRAVFQEIPTRTSLLKYHFHKAFKSMRFLATQKDLESWNPNVVAEYWHTHPGANKACAVHKVKITSIEISPDGTDTIKAQGLTIKNHYNLDIKVGEEVYIHLGWIIEHA